MPASPNNSRLRPWVIVLVAGTVLTGGCGPGRIWTAGGAARVCRDAIEAPHPDLRRIALERVADSGYHDSEPALRTYGVVVRTDPSSLVRRTAARALGASGSAAAVPPLQAVLAFKDHPEQVLPPDPELLTESLVALRQLWAAGAGRPDDQAFSDRVVRLFQSHPRRGVRAAAADLMGYFAPRGVIEPLIESLAREEFAVAYAAGQSLQRLTGAAHGTSLEAWQAWRQSNPDLAQSSPSRASASRGADLP